MTWSPQIDTEGAYLLYCIMQYTAFFLCFKVSQKKYRVQKKHRSPEYQWQLFLSSHVKNKKIVYSCINDAQTELFLWIG